jgi:hypothetical protein
VSDDGKISDVCAVHGEGLNIHFSTYERSWLRESLFAGRLTSSSAVAV